MTGVTARAREDGVIMVSAGYDTVKSIFLLSMVLSVGVGNCELRQGLSCNCFGKVEVDIVKWYRRCILGLRLEKWWFAQHYVSQKSYFKQPATSYLKLKTNDN